MLKKQNLLNDIQTQKDILKPKYRPGTAFPIQPSPLIEETGKKLKIPDHVKNIYKKEKIKDFCIGKGGEYVLSTANVLTKEYWNKLNIESEEEFQRDFIQWLLGQSPSNKTEVDQMVQNKKLKIKQWGTPWKDKPLVGKEIQEYVIQHLQSKNLYTLTLEKLYAKGIPDNLIEAWIYYKYIICRPEDINLDKLGQLGYLVDFDYYLEIIRNKDQTGRKQNNNNNNQFQWGDVGHGSADLSPDNTNNPARGDTPSPITPSPITPSPITFSSIIEQKEKEEHVSVIVKEYVDEEMEEVDQIIESTLKATREKDDIGLLETAILTDMPILTSEMLLEVENDVLGKYKNYTNPILTKLNDLRKTIISSIDKHNEYLSKHNENKNNKEYMSIQLLKSKDDNMRVQLDYMIRDLSSYWKNKEHINDNHRDRIKKKVQDIQNLYEKHIKKYPQYANSLKSSQDHVIKFSAYHHLTKHLIKHKPVISLLHQFNKTAVPKEEIDLIYSNIESSIEEYENVIHDFEEFENQDKDKIIQNLLKYDNNKIQNFTKLYQDLSEAFVKIYNSTIKDDEKAKTEFEELVNKMKMITRQTLIESPDPGLQKQIQELEQRKKILEDRLSEMQESYKEAELKSNQLEKQNTENLKEIRGFYEALFKELSKEPYRSHEAIQTIANNWHQSLKKRPDLNADIIFTKKVLYALKDKIDNDQDLIKNYELLQTGHANEIRELGSRISRSEIQRIDLAKQLENEISLKDNLITQFNLLVARIREHANMWMYADQAYKEQMEYLKKITNNYSELTQVYNLTQDNLDQVITQTDKMLNDYNEIVKKATTRIQALEGENLEKENVQRQQDMKILAQLQLLQNYAHFLNNIDYRIEATMKMLMNTNDITYSRSDDALKNQLYRQLVRYIYDIWNFDKFANKYDKPDENEQHQTTQRSAQSWRGLGLWYSAEIQAPTINVNMMEGIQSLDIEHQQLTLDKAYEKLSGVNPETWKNKHRELTVKTRELNRLRQSGNRNEEKIAELENQVATLSRSIDQMKHGSDREIEIYKGWLTQLFKYHEKYRNAQTTIENSHSLITNYLNSHQLGTIEVHNFEHIKTLFEQIQKGLSGDVQDHLRVLFGHFREFYHNVDKKTKYQELGQELVKKIYNNIMETLDYLNIPEHIKQRLRSFRSENEFFDRLKIIDPNNINRDQIKNTLFSLITNSELKDLEITNNPSHKMNEIMVLPYHNLQSHNIATNSSNNQLKQLVHNPHTSSQQYPNQQLIIHDPNPNPNPNAQTVIAKEINDFRNSVDDFYKRTGTNLPQLTSKDELQYLTNIIEALHENLIHYSTLHNKHHYGFNDPNTLQLLMQFISDMEKKSNEIKIKNRILSNPNTNTEIKELYSILISRIGALKTATIQTSQNV